MGDCRIRLLVAKKLLPTGFTEGANSDLGGHSTNADDSNNTSNPKPSEWGLVLNKIFSSDSTVREVVEGAPVVLPLLEGTSQESEAVCLWDCTFHPPKDITDWPLEKYSEIKGLKSKTLFDAGWFPSGTVRVSLKSDGVPSAASSSLQYDDHQYNLPPSDITDSQPPDATAPAVQLVGTGANKDAGTMLPSQVLHSVTQRFEDDPTTAPTEAAVEALRQRRLNRQARQQKEQERFQKLEARIRRLEEKASTKKNNNSNNNKPVSDQVKRMLIKSRATGAQSLKMQDRIYFQVAIMCDNDDENDDDDTSSSTEVFRYFSIQDTASRILSQFTCPKETKEVMQSELLVKMKKTTNTANEEVEIVYRRLPGIMRVYEAIEHKLLEPEFNNIVIRWYSPTNEEPTTSVLEEDQEATPTSTTESTGAVEPQAMEIDEPDALTATQVASPSNANETTDTAGSSNNLVVDDDLANQIQTMDEEEQKKSKKKKSRSSTTSTKVRQMLIKSKAKGDAKRIKMEDRFFFELITVAKSNNCESSFAYLGKKDPLGRILRDCVPSLSVPSSSKKEDDFELLVSIPAKEGHEVVSNQFRRLDNPSMTFHEAEMAQLIQPFDRIVIQFHHAK